MMDEASMMRRRLRGCCFGGSDSEMETLLSPTLSDTWNWENKTVYFPLHLILSFNTCYNSKSRFR